MLQAPPPVPPPPVVQPAFSVVPTEAEIADAAWRFGDVHVREGRGRMRCLAGGDGALTGCKPLLGPDVDPAFNAPLLRLADLFRLDPARTQPPVVTVAVRFPKLADKEAENLDKANAAARRARVTGDLRGEVALDCRLSIAGQLEGCIPAKSDKGEAPDPALVPRAMALAAAERFRPAQLAGAPMAVPVRTGYRFYKRGDTVPDWVRTPDIDQMRTVFPPKAAAEGISGSSRTRCVVTRTGRLRDCEVVAEEPLGSGFGGASLLMTPNFEMKPATEDGVAVESDLIIPIRWHMTGMQGVRTIPLRVTNWLPWTAAPTVEDMRAAAPWALKRKPTTTSLRCGVSPAGRLERCIVTLAPPDSETLLTAGKLLKLFATDVSAMAPAELAKLRVQVSLRFDGADLLPGAARRIDDPDWLTAPTAEQVKAAYPAGPSRPEGVGAVRCRVATDGVLSACTTAGRDAAFDEATRRLVTGLKVNGWTRAGEPVGGAELAVSLRLLPTGGWEIATGER